MIGLGKQGMGSALLWESVLEKCSLEEQNGDQWHLDGWTNGRVDGTGSGSSPGTD